MKYYASSGELLMEAGVIFLQCSSTDQSVAYKEHQVRLKITSWHFFLLLPLSSFLHSLPAAPDLKPLQCTEYSTVEACYQYPDLHPIQTPAGVDSPKYLAER